MTKCKPKTSSQQRPSSEEIGPTGHPLQRLTRQAVDVDFDGGTLTSDGGLLLLREADQRLDLIRRIAEAIPDPRDPRYTSHHQSEILTSRIFAIAAGYEDANDHQQLRHDPAFLVAAGRTPAQSQSQEDQHHPLASASTHCRFENRIDSKTNFKLHEILVETFLDSYQQPPEEIILDYDATDDPVHGNQEQRYFNGFYDNYCFLPLYVFCGDQLLVSYLRPSSVGAAHHSRAITRLLVQKIRARWPEVKIILRADGGFSTPKLINWCHRNGVKFVFGLPKNSVLVGKLTCAMTIAQIKHDHLGGKQTCFGWFRYKTNKTWNDHHWVVGKAEYNDKGANPRFVVTNIPSSDGVIDETWHRPRVNGKQVKQLLDRGTDCCPIQDPEEFLPHDVLSTRRDGEPDQGATELSVCRPHQLYEVHGQSVSITVVFVCVCVDGRASSSGACRDRASALAGGYDSFAVVQDRSASASASDLSPRCLSLSKQLPV